MAEIKKYLHTLDIGNNKIINLLLNPLTTAERATKKISLLLLTGVEGYVCYDTDENVQYFWDVGIQDWVASGGGTSGILVALPFTTDHLATTNNQYVIGDLVYYAGNVYRCIASNDSLQPDIATQYWTLLGAGYPLVQQPADWNSTSGNNQILNKPTITTPTVFQNEVHVSQIDGNDTTGDGTLLKPVATITKALTLVTVGSSRRTIIIHPGSYTESPSITVQYTVLTTFELLGGNTEIVGTVSTNKGCTISGIKMTNLTITAPTGTGNVNILNCEVSGTLTKNSTADYTLIRFCDIATTSITGSGLVAIFGGNPNFITVNNAGARVIVKNAVTVAPVLTAGSLSLVDSIVVAAVTNAFTTAAGTFTTLANSQFLVSALNNVAPIILNGFYSIINCIFDKPASTLVALSGTGGSLNSIVYSQYINADKFIKQGGTTSQFLKANGDVDSNTYLTTAVTSVGLSMPSAFTVTPGTSPVTSTGTLTVTGAGTTAQYVRGDGTLATYNPGTGGGGASVSYYLNGSIPQGTFGGVAFKQMSKTPVIGAGTDFTINADGYIQSFITDSGSPNQLLIPAGNWNFEMYFSASSGGGSPSFYVQIYKWDGTTLSLIASSSATPEGITNGTAIDLYTTAVAMPSTVLLATDRIAIRVFVTHSGRIITLHTEDSHLCQVITTFSTGITALNGLTDQVQNFATPGTTGTSPNWSSVSPNHTLNIPLASTASVTAGLISKTDYDNFTTAYTDRLKWDGGATGLVAATGRTSLGATTVGDNFFTLTNPSAITFPRINADNTVSALNASDFRTAIGAGTALSGTGAVYSTAGTITYRKASDSTSQTYAETIIWTGTTPPSGTTNHTYEWSQNGRVVNFRITILFGTAALAITKALLPFPSDMPKPVNVPGFTTSGISRMYILSCNGGNTQTIVNPLSAAIVYDTGTVNKIVVDCSPQNLQIFTLQGFYFTNS